MSDNKAQKIGEVKINVSPLICGGKQVKKKKCSRERCVEPTAAGRIRPTFLLTTLISVRLSTYSVWCLLLFNLGTPYNTTGRCRCYNTLLLLHLTVATAVQGCDETLREKEEIKLRPV